MKTYQSFYKNEDRVLEIEIDDQYGNDFVPSAAYVTVYDEKDIIVREEQVALVEENKIRTIISPTITATVGTYKVIWRILKSGRTYYHVTNLEIEEW